MLSMRPDPEIRVQKIAIPAGRRRIPELVLSPNEAPVLATGVLWIHGGGYILGMKEMVHMSRAVDLVKKFGAVVVSPGYRLAFAAPYPAALDDCYAVLVYIKARAADLGVRADQIMVGGESAGGGLCAALCIKARDTGDVNVAFKCPSTPCWTTGTRRPPGITTARCGTPGATGLRGAVICGGRSGAVCRPMPLPPD